VVASAVGTTIEWYDFFLYGVAAALVFPTRFFAETMDPFIAEMLSFVTFFAGFAARPLGAVIFGHLGDRIGRKRITAIGCVAMMVFPFIYFAVVDTGSIGLAFLVILFGLPVRDLQYGPQAAFISESFPGSSRYSGASLGYQLASITAGGPALLIALWLYEVTGTSMAVAGYVAVCAFISLVCVYLLKDTIGQLDHQ